MSAARDRIALMFSKMTLEQIETILRLAEDEPGLQGRDIHEVSVAVFNATRLPPPKKELLN